MLQATKGYKIITQWLNSKGYSAFAFQEETWQHILEQNSGLVNAPTGCGKTFSVFLGSVIQFINQHPNNFRQKQNNGLQLLWITPLRALAKDIGRAMEEAIAELNLPWTIGIRNGDTTTAERQKQKRNLPEILIITPESLHLLLAQKNTSATFKNIQIIAVDEWHELLGSKRGVQVELSISRIVGIQQQNNSSNSNISVWGISATIGNLEEAKNVLLAPLKKEGIIVKALLNKKIKVIPIIPNEIENYPWAGHLGIKMAESLIPIIEKSNTTLIFINTRGMSETWYQTILTIAPQLAGAIALHHGSIQQELRLWVEDALHTQKLKAVVCTASLDLGVDFRPVDTVIQVGSPKGVGRFLQRAGRSGHSPNATSTIYFLPTHSLELVEAAALTKAIQLQEIESKAPLSLCFDVLIQYLCTLAVGDGFNAKSTFEEIKSTFCFQEITENEWQEILLHIKMGGKALQQYNDYKKVELINGLYKIENRRLAMRHRMHIGTIVSDSMMKVKFISGGYIGVIEEWFISRLEIGDTFTLAGRNVELVMIKEMDVLVKKSSSKKSIVPSWMGGRMSLTANLGLVLRNTFNEIANYITPKENTTSTTLLPEIVALKPLFEVQAQLSHIPKNNELLVEQIETKDGFHLLIYPFEGRQVHEAMSAIIAHRISKIMPITFSIAMNDYGFELLSDQPIPVDDSNVQDLFTVDNLLFDIQKSMNNTEMAKRKFRDIAVIGGLIFQGMPGEHKKAKHLQSSASLLFKVFEEYDANNILLKQAYQEVLEQQMDEVRLRQGLQRMYNSKIVLTFPNKLTPLSFPIVVDGLNRNNLSSEKLEDRIKRMQQLLEK
jgi:ATP-dependent Lhr-like helicase